MGLGGKPDVGQPVTWYHLGDVLENLYFKIPNNIAMDKLAVGNPTHLSMMKTGKSFQYTCSLTRKYVNRWYQTPNLAPKPFYGYINNAGSFRKPLHLASHGYRGKLFGFD